MTEKGSRTKLAIKPNTKVWLPTVVHVERIGPLPAGVTVVDGLAMR